LMAETNEALSLACEYQETVNAARLPGSYEKSRQRAH